MTDEIQNLSIQPKSHQPPPLPEADEGWELEPQTMQTTPEPKPWYKSKTVWLNVAVMVVGLATSAQPQLKDMVSAETFGLITAGIGLANAVLRFVTHKPIGGK